MAVVPVVATMIGDPAGIGPEVIAKALATGEPYVRSRPVLIGCRASMERAVVITGVPMRVRSVDSLEDAGRDPTTLDILDTGQLDPDSYQLGEESAACGRATGAWLDELDDLARVGKVHAAVMGPIHSGSMKRAGTLDRVVSVEQGRTYLTLISGPVCVVHLTDHMPLSQVSAWIRCDRVLRAIQLIDESFRGWGVADPRIAVSGFNPHASGDEEEKEIAPAIARARDDGIDVAGPISPDTVFRHCIEDRSDIVLAMFHDQGHIAIKTWGFVGNCALILGTPHLFLSVAHGTAFDIVGKNLASHEMMLTAMNQAASLAAGTGFVRSR
jgi:4-hydroxy-L-threonine phosphate dehydrogenase PdxA